MASQQSAPPKLSQICSSHVPVEADGWLALNPAAELTAVCQKIRGLPWQKVRSFLQDGRTLTFLERLHRRHLALHALELYMARRSLLGGTIA